MTDEIQLPPQILTIIRQAASEAANTVAANMARAAIAEAVAQVRVAGEARESALRDEVASRACDAAGMRKRIDELHAEGRRWGKYAKTLQVALTESDMKLDELRAEVKQQRAGPMILGAEVAKRLHEAYGGDTAGADRIVSDALDRADEPIGYTVSPPTEAGEGPERPPTVVNHDPLDELPAWCEILDHEPDLTVIRCKRCASRGRRGYLASPKEVTHMASCLEHGDACADDYGRFIPYEFAGGEPAEDADSE